MYAVFVTGGKQYRASKGDQLQVEKLPAAEGENVEFTDVLLIGEGRNLKWARLTPYHGYKLSISVDARHKFIRKITTGSTREVARDRKSVV